MKKILRVLELKLLWIRSSISLGVKLGFLLYIPLSLISILLFKRKKINYLGSSFLFDNWTTPFTLMQYPFEISNKILNNLDIKNINTILDIGANCGQFALTLNYYLPNANIYSFEPNKLIYTLLEKNVSSKDKIKYFNYGIGQEGSNIMYFTPNKSAKGSLISQNATIDNNSDLEKVEINLISDISKLTNVEHYNLVKIDVEGYEYEVLNQIKGLTFKYLFIEVSAEKRAKQFNSSDLFLLIKEKFGTFNIVYQSKCDVKSECYDILLRF